MKHLHETLLILLTFCIFANTAYAADKPNVVLIYADDVGFGDVGVNGAKLIPTPNIDRLAREGLNFTDAHSSASTCTPSRFSLLTGVHAFRHNVRILPPNAPLIIPTDQTTLADVFKQAGYATGIVGKWHLGLGKKGTPVDWNEQVKPGPLELGFDECFLVPSTNDRVPCVYLAGHEVVDLSANDPLHVGRKLADVSDSASTQYPDGATDRAAMTYYESSTGHNNSVINGIGRIGYMSGGKSALWDDETMADVLVKRANDFIAKHKEEPFFLYYSSQDIHVPRTPHPRFQGRTKLGFRGDAMVQLDWAVGAITDVLDQHGLTENTLVIFTSDNGPTYDNGYKDGTTVVGTESEVDRGHDASGKWHGGKGTIYEGGTRVPMIVRWPARIEAGKTSKALIGQIDFLASFARLLDVELPQEQAIDSKDLLPAILGHRARGRDYLVEESRSLALREGDWKYVEPHAKRRQGIRQEFPAQLFRLDQDPAEQTDVSEEHPDKLRELREKLLALKASANLRTSSLPKAPNGFHWELQEGLTDDFDGSKLDTRKWHDHNPNWIGRVPGKFMPSSVSVKDGHLHIQLKPLVPADGEFTIASGTIQSKQKARYGYYECRMKASRLSASSNFWFVSDQIKLPKGTMNQELIIQFTIGKSDEHRSYMKSNAMVAFKSKGEGAKREKAKKTDRVKLASSVSDDFHTYGCWWVDANTLKFYVDGEYAYTLHPSTKFHDHPYQFPHSINLICETFDWQPLPTTEELTDETKNTAMFDYVRSYRLVEDK